jgi:hypothetical protein
VRIWVSILLLWAVGIALSTPAWADLDQSPAVLCPNAGYGAITLNANTKGFNSLWAVRQGEKPVKIPRIATSTLNNAYISNTSDIIFNEITVECHQVSREQPFRIHQVDTPNSGSPSAEVYISVRSGWSTVSGGQNAFFTPGVTSYHRSEALAC